MFLGEQVLLVVAPKGGDLGAVEAICGAAGLATCVILLNARLEAAAFSSEAQRGLFLGAFEPVFHLRPPPPRVVAEARAANSAASTPVVFRAFPGEWELASRPAVGSPRALAHFQARPTPEQVACRADMPPPHGEIAQRSGVNVDVGVDFFLPISMQVVSTLTDPLVLEEEGRGFDGQINVLIGKLSSIVGK